MPQPHLHSLAQLLRVVRMLLVQEEGDTLWLGRATPRERLAPGQRLEVTRAATIFVAPLGVLRRHRPPGTPGQAAPQALPGGGPRGLDIRGRVASRPRRRSRHSWPVRAVRTVAGGPTGRRQGGQRHVRHLPRAAAGGGARRVRRPATGAAGAGNIRARRSRPAAAQGLPCAAGTRRRFRCRVTVRRAGTHSRIREEARA